MSTSASSAIVYDWAWKNEIVTEKYQYRGFNIKVAYLSSRFGRVYTAVSDYGEPFADQPIGKLKPEAVKADIEAWIDSCLD